MVLLMQDSCTIGELKWHVQHIKKEHNSLVVAYQKDLQKVCQECESFRYEVADKVMNVE